MKINNTKGNSVYRYWQSKVIPTVAMSMIALFISPSTAVASNNDLDCEIAIIGGGPGGVHTAWGLVKYGHGNVLRPGSDPINKQKICVFEKEDKLGGRIYDVEIGKNGEKIPTGAMRNPPEHYSYKLLEHFNLDILPGLGTTTLIGVNNPNNQAAGQLIFRNSINDFHSYYNQDETLGETELAERLVCGPAVPKNYVGDQTILVEDEPVEIGLYAPDLMATGGILGKSIREYAQMVNVLGLDGYKLLRDTSTFRADFKPPFDGQELDAVSYLQYLQNDWSVSSYEYPKLGFGKLINLMANEAKANGTGAKFYMNEGITKLQKQSMNNRPYKLITSKGRVVNAKKVIIATDTSSLKKIEGAITQQIKGNQKFIDADSGHAITVQITTRWNKQWWNHVDANGVQYASHPQAPIDTNGVLPTEDDDETPIQRAGMDKTFNGGYCLTRVEMSTTDYWKDAQVIRSAYIDDPECAKKWMQLYKDGGIKAVNKKLLEGYKILFPKIFDSNLNDAYNCDKGEAKIMESEFTPHKHAWSALGKGASARNNTNDTVWEWSVKPLANEKVYLVGDGYVVSNGWSAAAYMSSVRVLNQQFGLNMPTLTANHEGDANVGEYPVFGKVLCGCTSPTATDCKFEWNYDFPEEESEAP